VSTLKGVESSPTILDHHDLTRRLHVPPTYVLVRDHLQQAASILQGTDQRSRQLRHIIERTIGLLEDLPREVPRPRSNVLDMADFRRSRL
jgi:hypothetical protein